MLGVVAGALAVTAPQASANPGGTALVISEVYGGGGNAGATYTHDYVELYNPTAAPISLATMSIQYRSAASTVAPAAGGVTSLATAGSVPAGDYFVVQLASQAAVGVAVPNVDFVGNSSTNLSGSNGQVYLANSTTAIDPDGAGDTTITDPAVIDFVGYGTAAIKEGATAAPSPAGNAASITRDEDDTDTDVNGADFASSDPTPGAGFAPPPPPEEFTGTIAEIQGTDADVSPHVGDIATTTGVVTAKFPLVDPKGFNGFYLQTGGTGGATDATPGASDAVFVFTPSYDETTLALGSTVTVTGAVSEFFGLTEITATSVATAASAQPAVTAWSAAYPTTAAAREAHEGELMAPTNTFTVTNSFNTNNFGEVGLATGTKPLHPAHRRRGLRHPRRPPPWLRTTSRAASSSTTARRSTSSRTPPPRRSRSRGSPRPPPSAWGPRRPSRCHHAATTDGVILDFRNSNWKFQPQQQVTNTGATVATFANTRNANLAPRTVGGDISLATFNVLNYFNTTGEEWVSSGRGTCTYFTDRAGTPIANNAVRPTGRVARRRRSA